MDTQELLLAAFTHHQNGALTTAHEIYASILAADATNIDVKYLFATCLLQEGLNADYALELLNDVIDAEPEHQPARLNRAFHLFWNANDYQSAFSDWEHILANEPYQQTALAAYCSALLHIDSRKPAIKCLERLVEIEPFNSEWQLLLCNTLRIEGRIISALHYAHQWVQMKSEHDIATAEIANTLARAELFDAAESLIEKIDNKKSSICMSKGLIYFYQIKLSKAINLFEKAIELNPDLQAAHACLSYALFQDGQNARAWKEHSLRKDKTNPLVKSRLNQMGIRLDMPEWQGEPLAGKTILIHSEQGLGDVIQFLRLVLEVQARGGQAIFIAYPEVLDLLASSTMKEHSSKNTNEKIDSIDYHTPILELGRYLILDQGSIPGPSNYLEPAHELIQHWASKLGHTQKPRIALSWAGNPNHVNDRYRSRALSDWISWGQALPMVQWISVQKGYAAKQCLAWGEYFNLLDLGNELHTLADTAAVISNIDLLITVDTSLAHLSGAMGKPVWMLLPRFGDWRWPLKGESTPWYPSMRIFRQQNDETWSALEERVLVELRKRYGAAERNGTPVNHGNIGSNAMQGHSEESIRLIKHLNSGKIIAPSETDRIRDTYCNNALIRYHLGQYFFKTEKNFRLASLEYETALSINPRWNEANINLGLCHYWLGNQQKANSYFEKSVYYNPENPLALLYAGWALNKAGLFEYSTPFLEKALKISPQLETARIELCHAYGMEGRFTEAEIAIKHINSTSAQIMLADIKLKQNRCSEALDIIENKINALEPQFFSEVDLIKAMSHALLENWNSAWSNFESRILAAGSDHFPCDNFPQRKRWDGCRLHEDTSLWIYCEQGIGDTLQFIRFIRKLPNFFSLTIYCQDSIKDLLDSSLPGYSFRKISDLDSEPDSAGYYIELLSLPHVLQTSSDFLEETIPYITGSTSIHADAESLLSEWDSHYKAGLVWAGNPKHKNDRNRSCPISQIEPLLQIDGLRIFSLQKDAASNQAYNLSNIDHISNLAPYINNWNDTASVIENLDLIISVDTAVAHIAAAMGKKVILLLPYHPDWRWGLNKPRTSWYPSVTIFRQDSFGDWGSAINKAVCYIKHIIGSQYPS